MDRLEAYERRAWRLAMLLTGDVAVAEGVVRRSIDAQSRPDRLPADRLDRLVIQSARSADQSQSPTSMSRRAKGALEGVRQKHRASRGVSTTPEQPSTKSPFSEDAAKAMHVLRVLPQQQREAWILQELDAVEVIHASKSMDCSRTALQRHLDLARRSMLQALGEDHDRIVAALKRDADALDPTPFIARRAERRRRMRHARRIVAMAVLVVAAIAVAVLLVKAFGSAP